MSRSAATEVLRAAGVEDAVGALREATAVRDRLVERDGLAVDDQQRLVGETPMDPTVVRLRPPDPAVVRLRQVALSGVALLVVVLALTAGLVPAAGVSPAGPGGVAVTAPAVRQVARDAWRGSLHPGVQLWPSRGARSGDTTLTGRAARSWAAAGRKQGGRGGSGGMAAPNGPAAVLYAGDLDGQSVVLLSDGHSVDRYTERDGAVRSEMDRAPRADVSAASALRLVGDGSGTRYLLAPWVTPGAVRDHLGGLARPRGGQGCHGPGDGPGGGARMLAGAGAAAHRGRRRPGRADRGRGHRRHGDAAPDVPPARSAAEPLPAHEMTYQDGPRVFQRMSCLEDGSHGADSMTDWRFWEGGLPEGVAATWVCLRVDQADGSGPSTSALLPAGFAPRTEADTTGGHACTPLAKDLVATGWWQAPSGRWYFLAAGSRHVVSITAADAAHDGRFVAPGPYPAKAAALAVNARNDAGAPVTVPSG